MAVEQQGGSCRGLVLHADVDAFFCQVEALRHPDPAVRARSVPLAVQQHQDVIAVDYAARAAGVRKHMAPAEARRLLAAAGGRLVHVYCEDGTRPSYRPYREVSAALMRLLRGLLPPGAVLEKASIDEAYMQLPLPPQQGLPPPPPRAQPPPGFAAAGSGAGAGGGAAAGGGAGAAEPGLAEAVAVAESLRREARAQLGLVVSVGVARNKLLAKLASRGAKPDGLRLLLGPGAVDAKLGATPVERLPGMGGRVAEALVAAGFATAAQLRGLAPEHLAARFGLRPAAAARLALWARGEDDRPVDERGPAKAIQVQMTLTPVSRPVPAVMAARAAASASTHPGPDTGIGPATWGAAATLEPLYPSAPDGRARLGRLVRGMAGDLVARVLLDRHEHGRWPQRLSVQLVTHGAGGRAASRSCAFPAPGLAPGGQGPAQSPGAAATEGLVGPGEGLVGAGEGLAGPGQGPDGSRSPRLGGAGATAAGGYAGGGGGGAGADATLGARGLIVGEHTFYRPGAPSALLEAVATNAMGLCAALLPAPVQAHAQPPRSPGGAAGPGPPLVEVHLTAHSFGSLRAANAAGAIGRFLSRRDAAAGQPPATATTTLGAAANAAAAPAGTGAADAAGLRRGDARAEGQPVRAGGSGPQAVAELHADAEDLGPSGRAGQKRRAAAGPPTSPPRRMAAAAAVTSPLEPERLQPRPERPGEAGPPQHPPAAQQPRLQQPAAAPPLKRATAPAGGRNGRVPARRPRAPPPAPIDLLELLGSLSGGGDSGGTSKRTGRSGGPAGDAADAAVRTLDGWLAAYGAPSLEEWWGDLGTEPDV
ncbi:hypothetical protein HYH03_013733 [Edaphochlamys debaryana]|uniref:UmuC domain-containing protein n=1 Tax=Edaphochlamys debaryana TaxID=47281 RepID=A0A836BSY2_9CHLO|nr:hypothetical protein HYH03_013733 [Edaphochlamys debaryana]|eukprot:KAG2487735.1 hypothetical protein HYH03_013733 [Edaphochlamys debaryana]